MIQQYLKENLSKRIYPLYHRKNLPHHKQIYLILIKYLPNFCQVFVYFNIIDLYGELHMYYLLMCIMLPDKFLHMYVPTYVPFELCFVILRLLHVAEGEYFK